MRLAIRVNNHAIEINLGISHLRYVPKYHELNIVEEDTREVPEEVLAQPDHGLTLTPVPVADKILLGHEDYVGSGKDEIHIDNSWDTYFAADGSMVKATQEELVQQYTPCPCIANNVVGSIINHACVECTEAGTHSGGCSECNGTGRIPLSDPCFCTRAGYILCFECSINTPHSLLCTNCDGSTFILRLGSN